MRDCSVPALYGPNNFMPLLVLPLSKVARYILEVNASGIKQNRVCSKRLYLCEVCETEAACKMLPVRRSEVKRGQGNKRDSR
jgi:hypothetical protein